MNISYQLHVFIVKSIMFNTVNYSGHFVLYSIICVIKILYKIISK